MKCVIEKGGEILVKESNTVSPSEGYCRFSVKASGICGSDIPRAFAGGAYHYPIVVGHEFSGVVTDSLKNELVGKRACVFPILPCGECRFCKKSMWANCTNYDYYGSRRDGGMQSEITVKEKNLVFLPDNVSFEMGAMVEPMAVCLHAVKRAGLDSNSSVLVYGAGTIGLLIAMWARAFGVDNIYIKDIDEKRQALACQLGFMAFGGECVDTVFEACGAPSALSEAIINCDALGRIVLVGHSKLDLTLEDSVYIQLLRKQLMLIGCWNSDFSDLENDWIDSVQALAEGKINPEVLITHRIPLSQAPRAFDISVDKNIFSNKVMVVNDDDE